MGISREHPSSPVRRPGDGSPPSFSRNHFYRTVTSSLNFHGNSFQLFEFAQGQFSTFNFTRCFSFPWVVPAFGFAAASLLLARRRCDSSTEIAEADSPQRIFHRL